MNGRESMLNILIKKEGELMTAQSRQTKVLVALLASIIVCTIILNMLGHNPPSAGAFCLSQYNRLVPVEKLISYRDVRRLGYWMGIEIYFGEYKAGDRVLSGSNCRIEKSDSLSRISEQEGNSCHFIINNGHTGYDGQIEPTVKWNQQLPADRSTENIRHQNGHDVQTIYICVASNGQSAQPTNFQIKRAQVLIDTLCKEFNIDSESVIYPNSWNY
jgi:hypothetical protein